MSDIYDAPASDLSKQVTPSGEYGSIEQAVNGTYKFDISDTLSESWKLTNGAKWPFHKLFGVYFVFMILAISLNGIANAILSMYGQNPGSVAHTTFAVVFQIAYTFGFIPIGVGLFIAGVRRANNADMPVNLLIKYYNRFIPLAITSFLIYILVLIGLMLFVLPGIYLSISYLYATTLVAEKGMSPWEAMETSRKAIHHHWFGMLGFWLLMGIIMFLSMIPLGIGLIWTLPWMLIAMGIIYRNMFGIEPETLQDL